MKRTVHAAALAVLVATTAAPVPAQANMFRDAWNAGARFVSAIRSNYGGVRTGGTDSRSAKQYQLDVYRNDLGVALQSYDKAAPGSRQQRSAARAVSGIKASIREVEGWPN